MGTRQIELRVNGALQQLEVADHELLIDTLRDRLHLYGTREGCGTGVCGTCTVLLDGLPVSSCLTLVARLDGCSVETIEGLAPPGELHPIQEAFLEKRGYQCGFCTPGMILATKALLGLVPMPDEDQIKSYLAGNICRCAGYPDMVRAVQNAAHRLDSPNKIRPKSP